MPERKDHNFPRNDVVVDVVANTIKLEAAKLGILSRRAALPDARLQSEQLGGSFKVFGDRTRRGRSVGGPPHGRSFELSKCSRRDFNGEHGPSVGAQLVQDFRDGNGLATE